MFGRGFTIGRLFGLAIRIDWSWMIIAVLLTWSLAHVFPNYYMGLSAGTYWWMGLAGALGFFLCIILHELGHALAARHYRIPMRGITLFIFGGVAEMTAEPPSPISEFVLAIAGPLVTVVLSAIFFGVSRLSYSSGWPLPATGVLGYLSWINLVVLAFNLVPAFPLDGGRVLRSVLWAWKKNLRWATKIAATIGTIFAVLWMAWGIVNFIVGNFVGGLWFLLIGLFIRSASQMSYRQVIVKQALEGEPVSRFMTANPVTVAPATPVKAIVEDYLYKYPYNFYPVVEDGHLLGCVTLERVKDVPPEQWEQKTAETVAAPCSEENMIRPETDAVQALSEMSRKHVSRLMVVDRGRLLGIVALRDLVNFLSRKLELEGA